MAVRIKVRMRDLKVGDVIQLFEGAYGTATVKQIKDGEVILFRPYTSTADFTYGNNEVICYIGIEFCTYLVSEEYEYELFARGDLK